MLVLALCMVNSFVIGLATAYRPPHNSGELFGDSHFCWTSDTVMTMMMMMMMMMLRGEREGNEGGGDDRDERGEETSDTAPEFNQYS